jgi:hypothetical protein
MVQSWSAQMLQSLGEKVLDIPGADDGEEDQDDQDDEGDTNDAAL